MPLSKPASRILVVDDDEGMLLLMAETLRAEGYDVATANSSKTARTWLEQQRPDLMILDLKLRDGSGPVLVAELPRAKAPVPFVVVTGQGDEKIAVEIMKQGALDYVMKNTALLDLLPSVVKRALHQVGQREALAAAAVERRRLEREVLEVGERERHSIGADLHDGLGQQLTALEFMCTALKADAADHPDLAKRLDAMGRMLREAIVQTRFLASGLVPVGGDADALQISLTQLAHGMNALGKAQCVAECPQPIGALDRFVAGQLYLIAQEAVNNAIKHARARQIVIRLTQSPTALLLEISDNGTGLPARRGKSTGLGLGLMKHRAQEIGAELTIRSRRNEGVVVCCHLPLES